MGSYIPICNRNYYWITNNQIMENKMKASIIIPMYNAEKHIEELLEALTKQSSFLLEVIIVDDGSTDNSFKIAIKTRINFPLKIIKQENQGPATARNMGIKEAKSDIIIFLDSDCIPTKNFVKNILKPFKNPEISGVQGEYITKNFNNLIARYVGYEIEYRHRNMKGKIDHIATYACAYRKKDLGEGFLTDFKEPNMEDIELSYRLSEQGKKLVFQSLAKVKHPHPENIFKYLKQQFKRGYWRVLGHYKHPKKLLKDSYFGSTLFIQGFLVLLLFLSFLFPVNLTIFRFFSPKEDISFFSFIEIFKALPFLFPLLLLYFSNFPFILYCIEKEREILVNKKSFICESLILFPLIASLRSIVGVLGFGWGILNFYLNK